MTNEAVPCSRCSSDIYCEMNGCQRLTSAAAPAAQPATPLREVLSDADILQVADSSDEARKT